ncbi:hypothetical protein CC1G_08114 [Coprinopsis cinerea okayama7|uniref:F-box domain-containing protein n=1 Tax=Coprinopsis cinerea (strain Okayama-7 / 130 / ATCC MYA-4618 / FGSC 9003) TaxID=240176 RepID=A8NVJ7_COPC7|nr:hypothetical protein CC1G_08114 [Coprinopsis cinerea okayama7\|eukprot:XP_001836729.1 hypothetical protein CC1G_08114 [Coprinopsis cinerea okayama7\
MVNTRTHNLLPFPHLSLSISSDSMASAIPLDHGRPSQDQGVQKPAVNHRLQRKSTLAPIHLLPPELLAIIMRVVLHHYRTAWPNERRTNLFQLRSVCRHWKETGDSNSDFWRSLKININFWDRCETSADGVADFGEKVTWWFSHAGSEQGLELIITRKHYRNVLKLADVVAFLSQSDFNWKTLAFPGAILFGISENIDTVLNDKDVWNTVKNLSLNLPLVNEQQLRRMTTTFPSLETLSMKSQVLRFDSDTIPFNHPTLTSLELTAISGSFEGFATYISELQALEELILSSCSKLSTFGDNQITPITHRSLKRLVLDRLKSAETLLDALTLPSLQLLHLASFTSEPEDPAHLEAFLMRSSPQGLTLSLERVNWPLSDFVLPTYPIDRLHMQEVYPRALSEPFTLPASLRTIVCALLSDEPFVEWARKLASRALVGPERVAMYIPNPWGPEEGLVEGRRILAEVRLDVQYVGLVELDMMLCFQSLGSYRTTGLGYV